MKSLFVYVPDELYAKFRMKVIEERTTIKEIILRFLSLYIDEEKNDKKQKGEVKKNSEKAQK
jgi:hypothetical protein